MICPNKNLPEWQALEKTNPELALYYWNIHNGNPPNYLTDSKVLEDLFESNSELANAVYEALGYSYTGEYSPAALYESGIKTPDKKDYLTYSVVENKSGKKYINTLNKGKKSTDRGIGKNAYYKFIIENKGKNITTDTELSIAGKKVLEQLEKEGYVTKTDAKVTQTKNSGAGYTLDVYDKPLYEFTDKMPESYLTLEQKQQALQQYSQYVDSIFPDSKVKDIVYHSRFTIDNIKNKDRWKNGFYSGTRDQADLMAEMAEDGSNALMTTVALLINMQNPKVTDYVDRKVENYKNTNDGFIIEATQEDALQLIGDRDGYNPENFKKEYVVFEPEQIHILGNKQDIEGFKQFVGKNAGMYELSLGQVNNDNIVELDSQLLEFAKNLGIKTEEVENLKERLGIDAIGFTDLINKLILFAKDRNVTTLPEEVAHVAVMFLGMKHPIIQELLGRIQEWDKYQAIKDRYLPIYKNEYQVEIEAVGKLIAESIVSNYNEQGIDPSFLKRTINDIKTFFQNLFSRSKVNKDINSLNLLADKIATEVLKGNYSYFTGEAPTTERLNYQEALDNNPFAASLVNTFTKLQGKLTGSLALAAQGDTVYRDSKEPIHDVDFVVYDSKYYSRIKLELENMGAVKMHEGIPIVGTPNICYTHVVPAKGFKIIDVQRDYTKGLFPLKSFTLVDELGNEVIPTSSNVMPVDFFIHYNESPEKIKKTFNTKFSLSQDIYAAKLALSSLGINERLFKRAKDQKDYILSTPKNFYTPSPAFTYFQLENPLNVDFEDCQ